MKNTNAAKKQNSPSTHPSKEKVTGAAQNQPKQNLHVKLVKPNMAQPLAAQGPRDCFPLG